MRGFVFVALLAVAGVGEARAQDAAAGEKVFAVCKACHQVGETAKNDVGPLLNGIIGRKAGSVRRLHYSAANKNSGITWDEATFRDYIRDPKAKIPGTKMIYAGLKDEQNTNDLIAFLKQFDADGRRSSRPSRFRERRSGAGSRQENASKSEPPAGSPQPTPHFANGFCQPPRPAGARGG